MIQKSRLIFLAAGTLLMVFVMMYTGKSLKNPATPLGIVNLELARNATDVQNILNAWDNDISKHTDVIADAKKNTWLDFIFILFYASFFYYCCKKIITIFKKGSLIHSIGNIVAIGALTAGFLDILENIGMLQSLYGNVSDLIALFTSACSTIKWVLVFVTVIFLVIAGCYRYIIFKNPKPIE